MITVAIIPARGGSKRIPRKNIREFCGRPILTYPVATALGAKSGNSALFDEVFVSTDDENIAAVARHAGATVIARPAELADDYATTVQVIGHAVRYLRGQGAIVAHACCIYPCTPFVEPQDLDLGARELATHRGQYAFPVTRFRTSPMRAMRVLEDMRVEVVHPSFENVRSQDFDPRYHDAGQWYWGTGDAWVNEVPIYSRDTRAVIIPSGRGIDIDNEEDWQLAEAIYRGRRPPAATCAICGRTTPWGIREADNCKVALCPLR